MTGILDTAPYPHHRAEARRLLTAFAQLYPTSRAALMVAAQAGVDTSLIFAEQAPLYTWKEIVEAAAVAGLLRPLVETVRDRTPASSPFRGLIDDVIADRPIPVSGAPVAADGAPVFVRNDDSVTENEALLFHDDLTIQIGRVPRLITTLQCLATLAPAVCKLTVLAGGQEQFGTGFRIGSALLLTNWHVLYNLSAGSAPPSTVTAEFGYDDDGQGGILAATVIKCDPGTTRGSAQDDWAVITAMDGLDPAWPVIALDGAVKPDAGTAAYIIQHPQGGRKRISIIRNQVSFVDDRVVQYLADTQVGSSGSPVFDADGRLVALHHAGGRPQEVVGRAPMRKNEGIRISRITAGLGGGGG